MLKKNKYLAVLSLSVVSFLSLGYSIVGMATMSAQLNAVILLTLAFMICREFGGGYDNEFQINFSSKLLFLYCALFLFGNVYFMVTDSRSVRSLLQSGDLVRFNTYSFHSDYPYLLNKSQVQHVLDLERWSKNIKKDSKILVIGDNSAGLYRVLHQPDYTPFPTPIPMYVYSQERLNEVVDFIKHNDFDYIIWSLLPDDYVNFSQFADLQNFLKPYIVPRFKKENNIYKTYDFYQK